MSALLDPHAPRRVDTQDFSAVILVGYGENLYPFNQGTNVQSKALMPVGNVPIINIVLDWVFAGGLTDILIIVPPTAEAAISEYLQQTYSSFSHPRAHITLKSYADGEDDDEDEDEGMGGLEDKVGTARLLRRFRSLIRTDFVLLPCDISFPSNLTLASILDKHRSTPDAVLTSIFYEPTDAVRESEETMLVGLDKDTDELLLIQGLDTIEYDLQLRMALIDKHPTISLSKRLLDSHVYVFRRTVLDLLATRRSKELSSLREQFVPWLIKGAWQEGLGHRWATILAPPRRDPLAAALARSISTPYDQAASYAPLSTPSSTQSVETPLPSLRRPSAGDTLIAFKEEVGKTGKSARKSKQPTPIGWTCRVIVVKPEEPVEEQTKPAQGKGKQQGKAAAGSSEPEVLIRANNLAGYWEVNRRLIRSVGAANAAAHAAGVAPVHHQVTSGAQHVGAGATATTGGAPAAAAAADAIAPSAQISPDSLIGDGVRIGERASIKKCVVGRHCNIGKGAKLTGCILWDWVTVEDNARLENVILCGNVRIGEKATIKDCEFGPGFEAKPGVVLKGERLIAGQEV
ncbi:Translation initiation factor eIF-2B subunit gamma [Vanrija albida]|uniref:Translation initiation factor eIF2B subunit gamma n=1 Tax=Vanrija albida TaxID=181172 RepID=A0ABR3Q233_9TREE